VPLFIEELTKSARDSGNAFGDSEIPETLRASLLARLDRLGPDAKELAQISAVVGREFGAALLRAVNYAERALWDGYIEAFEDVISATSTPKAPWYVIPSNHKWFRNLAVSQIMADSMEALGMAFPKPFVDLAEIRRQYHEAVEESTSIIGSRISTCLRGRAGSGVPQLVTLSRGLLGRKWKQTTRSDAADPIGSRGRPDYGENCAPLSSRREADPTE
jgi:hypothetical protein